MAARSGSGQCLESGRFGRTVVGCLVSSVMMHACTGVGSSQSPQTADDARASTPVFERNLLMRQSCFLRVMVVHHRRVQYVLYSNVPVLTIPGAVAGAEDEIPY